VCINWFKKKKLQSTATSTPTAPPVTPQPAQTTPLSLPNPEEPKNLSQTLANVNIDNVFQAWYESYNVPIASRSYFRNTIVVDLNDRIPYPAGTWEAAGIRHLQVRPEWCNAGVLAHEEAHCSYALLTEAEKVSFEKAYNNAQSTPYIVLLHSVNTYMNQTDGSRRHVEGHAELYRYIGLEKLPETLKQFYPKLI
jgi:hypothetical protein